MWDLVRGAAQLKQPATAGARPPVRRDAVGESRPARIPRAARSPSTMSTRIAIWSSRSSPSTAAAIWFAGRRATSPTRGGRRSSTSPASPAIICRTPSRPRSAIPLATEAHAVTFAADAYWRGETHRLCDRPAGLIRLIDELIDLGVEQVVLVSAAPELPGPHALRAPADRRPRAARRIPPVDRSRHRPRRDDDDRRRAHLHDAARPQSDRPVRFLRRLRRSVATAAGPRRADEPRLRGRISPVHRTRRRRVRRARGEVRGQKPEDVGVRDEGLGAASAPSKSLIEICYRIRRIFESDREPQHPLGDARVAQLFVAVSPL